MEMFGQRGFENTSVEQIAGAAGMSRSSFFRYFATKEDVILGDLVEYGQQILDALVEQPDTESTWTALRAALDPVIPVTDVSRARQASRLVSQTPSLRARHYEKIMAWQAVLLPEVARRLGLSQSGTDPRPTALIACALACYDAAIAAWTIDDTSAPLAELLDLAMNSIRPQGTL